jgi:hypothetical protein
LRGFGPRQHGSGEMQLKLHARYEVGRKSAPKNFGRLVCQFLNNKGQPMQSLPFEAVI